MPIYIAPGMTKLIRAGLKDEDPYKLLHWLDELMYGKTHEEKVAAVTSAVFFNDLDEELRRVFTKGSGRGQAQAINELQAAVLNVIAGIYNLRGLGSDTSWKSRRLLYKKICRVVKPPRRGSRQPSRVFIP